MHKTRLLIIGGILIFILIAGVAWFVSTRRAVAPQPVVPGSLSEEINSATTSDSEITSTSTSTSTSTTVPVSPNRLIPELPSIAKGDTVTSWDFQGAYTGSPELIMKAETEIKRLSSLIGKGTYPDMNLFVSIANQYELLGNGKQEYDYLGRAIEVGGTTAGIPWHNLGVLMERLGALETARVAYQKATLIQPQLKQWHFAYLEFLTIRMKDNVTDIEKAFAAALTNLGQDTDILQLRTEWQKP